VNDGNGFGRTAEEGPDVVGHRLLAVLLEQDEQA
jgi:hypothetical protein